MASKGQRWEQKQITERKSIVRKLQLRYYDPKEMVEAINESGKFSRSVNFDMIWRDIREMKQNPVSVDKVSIDDLLSSEMDSLDVVRNELWKMYRKMTSDMLKLKALALIQNTPKERLGLIEKAGFILKAGNYSEMNKNIINISNFLQLLDLILELSNNYIPRDVWDEWLDRVNVLVKTFEGSLESDEEIVDVKVEEESK